MKNLKIFFFLIAALFLFSSCGFIIRSNIKKDDDNVPPNFGKEKTTLLVLEHKRKGYNKKISKIIKNHYTGEYVFASNDELNTKYADTTNFRYILNDEVTVSGGTIYNTSSGPKTGQSPFQTVSAAGRSFHIYDRKTKKKHGVGVSSGTSWKKILKVYLKKLDNERKKNETK